MQSIFHLNKTLYFMLNPNKCLLISRCKEDTLSDLKQQNDNLYSTFLRSSQMYDTVLEKSFSASDHVNFYYAQL